MFFFLYKHISQIVLVLFLVLFSNIYIKYEERKTWLESVEAVMAEHEIDKEDVHD